MNQALIVNGQCEDARSPPRSCLRLLILPRYSNNGDDYELLGEIGFGATSRVHRAIYKPLATECAVKVINVSCGKSHWHTCHAHSSLYQIDRMSPSGMERLRREAQLMSLSKHENVLRVRGEWSNQNNLYIAVCPSTHTVWIVRFTIDLVPIHAKW